MRRDHQRPALSGKPRLGAAGDEPRPPLDPADATATYFRRQPPRHRRSLLVLRETILEAAPEAEEVIRRRVPAYRSWGRPLVSIGAARDHVSLYVMYGNALTHLAERLTGLDVSTTVVRFDPSLPIPVRTVREIVRFRRCEIAPASDISK